mgnify:CR=1 FL=1
MVGSEMVDSGQWTVRRGDGWLVNLRELYESAV